MTYNEARNNVLVSLLDAMDKMKFADKKEDKYFKHEQAQLEKKLGNVEKKLKGKNADRPF